MSDYEKENVFRAVVYTDGSTYHPSYRDIGYIGSSAHGFIYNVENIGFPNKDNPSSSISTTTAGYATMVNNDVKVTPDVYIDALYPRDELLTNNVAEVTAIYLTINKLLNTDYKLDTIYIKSDSSYAIHIYEELLYANPTKIEDKKNGDLWCLIRDQLMTCQDKSITVKMIKVRGHSGNFGNDIADILANHARYLSEQYIETKKIKINKEYFFLTDGKKYWKPNIEKNPFLTCKSLYFTQYDRQIAKEKDIDPRYAIMDYPTSKELGVGTNEALFGLLYVKRDENKNILDEEFQTIEKILDRDKEIVGSISTLSELNLGSYYNRDFKHYQNLLGDEVYRPNKYGSGVSYLDSYLTLRTFQGLAKLTYNKTLELEKVYEKYINNDFSELTDVGDDKYYKIDITDLIYKEVFTKAKVPVAKKECIVGQKDKSIDKILEYDKQKIKVCINLGTEIIPRNNLKRLEKEIKGVYLCLYKHKKVIQFSCIVDTDKTLAILTNLYTRNILLK